MTLFHAWLGADLHLRWLFIDGWVLIIMIDYDVCMCVCM